MANTNPSGAIPTPLYSLWYQNMIIRNTKIACFSQIHRREGEKKKRVGRSKINSRVIWKSSDTRNRQSSLLPHCKWMSIQSIKLKGECSHGLTWYNIAFCCDYLEERGGSSYSVFYRSLLQIVFDGNKKGQARHEILSVLLWGKADWLINLAAEKCNFAQLTIIYWDLLTENISRSVKPHLQDNEEWL